MSDAATMVSSLRERYAELRDLYDATFREFNADGLITEDERVRLDAISAKLAEIERLLNQAQDAAAEQSASGGAAASSGGQAPSGGASRGGAGAGGGEEPGDTGDILSDAFDAVTEAGSEALGAAGDMLGDAANAAGDLLSGLTETFTGSAREIAQSAHDAAERAASGLAGAVGDAAEAARRAAETAAQEASARAEEAAGRAEEAMREANELTGEAAEAAMQRAQEAARLAREAAEEAAAMLGTLVGEAEQQLRGVGRQIVEGAEGAARQAGEAIDTAADEARDAAEDAREAASGIEEEVRRLAGAASDLAGQAAQRLASLIEEKKRLVEEAVAAAVEAARAAAERAEQVVRDITGIGFTEAEEEKLAELEAAGLDQEEREALMRQARDDPGVLAQATAALSRMEELSVPAGDRGELIRLAQANQAGFDAAMEVIANMDGGGDMDVSDDAMADLAVKITEAETGWDAANTRLEELVAAGAPQAEIDALAAEMEALAEAADQAQADFANRSEKRTLLDALSYGPLSVDRPEPMEPEDVTALIQAYGRNAEVANSAIELAGRAEDPSVIAQNVGGVLDVTEGGFAPPGGDPLAEGYDGEFDAMAVNMLRNGAAMGQEYFDGAQDYYASGAQTQPDPCGGRSGDDVGEVNIRRTAMMGREMLDENGQVNVGTDDAQAAMDHMLYHPGSLSEQSYSPNVTGQMRGVYDLFSDPATSEDASNVINGITAPADGAPNADGARSLVGRTMDVDPDSVSDEDTRAAVLSGMLTTFHQGNVGSCFATGAARRQRIENPIQTMENMAEIATTGQFQSPLPGPPPMPPIPANQNIPDGENPMMRSLEYTVAAGSAMLSNSNEHGRMNDGLWDTGGNGRGLGEIEGIVGSETWDGTGEVDENGDLDEGMETRLRRALAQQLRFDYNARELDTSGPGDGSSSHGAFEVIYQGNTIETEDAFQNAVEAIAMSAAGSPDEATREAISELIQSDAFVDSIYAAYGTNRSQAPWNLSGGGSGQQAVEFLTGNRENYTEYYRPERRRGSGDADPGASGRAGGGYGERHGPRLDHHERGEREPLLHGNARAPDLPGDLRPRQCPTDRGQTGHARPGNGDDRLAGAADEPALRRPDPRDDDLEQRPERRGVDGGFAGRATERAE